VTDFTALAFSYYATLSTRPATFFRGKGKGGSEAFLGSLAYRRSMAQALLLPSTPRSDGGGTPSRSVGPFADVSLSEDLDFVERALAGCYRMLPVAGVPLVYTRHAAVRNTWLMNITSRLQAPGEPPSFVTPQLRAAYIAAEADAGRQVACTPLRRHAPPSLHRPLSVRHPWRYPFMPSSCCDARDIKASWALHPPCTTGGNDCGRRDYCGRESQVTSKGTAKGVCGSRCTCAGEEAHGAPGSSPCGIMCCRYWQRYWQEHPERCEAITAVRPLKALLCGSSSASQSSQKSDVVVT